MFTLLGLLQVIHSSANLINLIEENQAQVTSEGNSFLGFRNFLGSSPTSSESLVEEAAQLCKSMCIADAVHDLKIVDNVQNLQSRSMEYARALRANLEQMEIEYSIQLCTDILNEMEKDILHVTTETCTKTSESVTKSTVRKNSH
jgi:hypothetical protein